MCNSKLYALPVILAGLIFLSNPATADLRTFSCDTGLRTIFETTDLESEIADFQPSCFEVAPGHRVRDAEFSPDFKYATWQINPTFYEDFIVEPGQVFVAPMTRDGDIDIDALIPFYINPAPTTLGRNGPEWGLSLDNLGNTIPVVYATIVTPDYGSIEMARIAPVGEDWQASSLPESRSKGFAIASQDPGEVAKLYFRKFTGTFPNMKTVQFAWRRETDEPTDTFLAKTNKKGRWIPGTNQILLEKAILDNGGNKIPQAAIYFPRRDESKLLFNDGKARRQMFAWHAPELRDNPEGDLAFLAQVEGEEQNVLEVYKQIEDDAGSPGLGLWVSITSISPVFPYVWSPEAFVNPADGRSYILMSSLMDRPLQLREPAVIWIARLPLPGESNVVKWIISEEPYPGKVTHKNDPEFFFTETGEIRAVYVDFGIKQ